MFWGVSIDLHLRYSVNFVLLPILARKCHEAANAQSLLAMQTILPYEISVALGQVSISSLQSFSHDIKFAFDRVSEALDQNRRMMFNIARRSFAFFILHAKPGNRVARFTGRRGNIIIPERSELHPALDNQVQTSLHPGQPYQTAKATTCTSCSSHATSFTHVVEIFLVHKRMQQGYRNEEPNILAYSRMHPTRGPMRIKSALGFN
jgi:hypothetical protein